MDCLQVAVNASDGHLNTCLIEVPLQDTLQNQTVRVTTYCIGSILAHTYTQFFYFSCNHTIICCFLMFGVPRYYCGFGDVSYFLTLHWETCKCMFPRYTRQCYLPGRLQYVSDIEQCKVAHNVMPMGLEGKADEEAESAHKYVCCVVTFPCSQSS